MLSSKQHTRAIVGLVLRRLVSWHYGQFTPSDEDDVGMKLHPAATTDTLDTA